MILDPISRMEDPPEPSEADWDRIEALAEAEAGVERRAMGSDAPDSLRLRNNIMARHFGNVQALRYLQARKERA